jgi:hypothetical protein
MKNIIDAIKKCCKEEVDFLEKDLTITDGTEQIFEGRQEFAGQILKIIARLKDDKC